MIDYIEYGLRSLPGTIRVVNPAWRKLDAEVRKARQAERRLQAEVTVSSVARASIRDLFVASADIEPDEHAKALTIRIHRLADPAQDKAIAGLFDEPTQQGFCHPETGARMIHALV